MKYNPSDGKQISNDFEYDFTGRLVKTTAPNGIDVLYHYNPSGNLHNIRALNKDLWTCTNVNNLGQITHYKLGSKSSVISYDTYGILQSQSFANAAKEYSYSWDDFNNLASRTDEDYDLKEDFSYDELNRLILSKYYENDVEQADNMALEYDHSGMGNIQSKSDVSDKISYGEFGAGPNALTSLKNPASGFTPWPQHISYTAFNKVSTIIDTVENNDTIRLDLHYGFDNQRRKSILSKPGSGNKTKYFFGNYEIHNDDTGEKCFLFVNSPVGLCAIIESYEENQVPVQKVWHSYTDHLGSLVYLENADNSNETLEYSYDAWGNPRKVSDWLDSNPIDELIADRGYTGHEHLTEFGLINMNGRVYDPKLGRFLSPDPFVQAPHTVGGFNRYTYCFNNPLKYTDPSGYMADPYWIGGFEGAYASGQALFYQDSGPNRSGGRVDGTYQGIWRKMGVYDNTSIGYRYDWEEERYEDIYGNEVEYSEVYSNYISKNGNRYIYVAYTDCYLVSEKWGDEVTLKYKAFTAYRLEQVYSPNFINEYIASSGVIDDFNTTWNILMGGAGTLTGIISNGMHNSIYWVQKNGKVRLTKNIGKNYLLQRSNKIVAQTLYSSKIVAQSFTNINIIYSAANYGISWALNGNIPSFGKGMDLFFTSMAAIPGVGWAVSGSYWTISAVSYAITGKWMSEHMDNWVY